MACGLDDVRIKLPRTKGRKVSLSTFLEVGGVFRLKPDSGVDPAIEGVKTG
jgi:hypothetical protein